MKDAATKTGGRSASTSVVPGKAALSIGRPSLPEPEGFSWQALSTLARLESGHTPSRSRPDYWDGGIPWVGIKDATGNHGRIIGDTLQKISQSGLDNSSARLLPAGTVCLSRTASVGYVIQTAVEMATSQDFVNWVCGPQLSPSYLRYLLMSEQESVRRFAYGTIHQTMYYPDAKALYVLLPDHKTQSATAEMLSALDDKVAALDQVILASGRLLARKLELLLANGSTQLRTIGEIVRFRNSERRPLSSAERSERVGRVPYYGATSSIDLVDEAIFNDRLVLVGEDGSVVDERTGAPVLQYIWGAAWVNNHAHVLEGATISTELLFHVLRTTNVSSFVTGAVQPKLSMANLKQVPVHVPHGDQLSTIEHEVQNLMASERANSSQIELLQEFRDALLPALMSGRLRVKDAERAVEEVL